MKILFIHTYYREKGGEDNVFEQDCKLFQQSEHVASFHFQNNTGRWGAMQFLLSIWNVSAYRKLKRIIENEKPDIVHFHNLHYASGPVVIRAAKRAGIPVVQTLHNFRLLCPSALLLHNNALFVESLRSKFPWKAIRRKVYHNSFFQTFWLSFVTWFHKIAGTWKMCDRYIVLTDFSKNIFARSSFGIPAAHFIVNPNFVTFPGTPGAVRKNHFLFVGRLSPEKGINVLLDAVCNSGHELHIAGDGPLKESIKELCRRNRKIHYLGQLDKKNVLQAMRECTALIFPSIWYEGMPMTILEAFSAGTPVIASNCGAMTEMISHRYDGLLFKTGDSEDLAEKLNYWQSLADNEKKMYSANALKEHNKKYSPEQYKKRLLKIYNDAIKYNSRINHVSDKKNILQYIFNFL
jgi:glycosyltransferase involved in cell wall biosynthesis